MRVNAEGETLWPKEVQERLDRLLYYRGDYRDILAPVALDLHLDPREMMKNARWRRAYLGRYLRFSPSDVDQMTRAESNAYVELVGELVSREAGKVASHFENL